MGTRWHRQDSHSRFGFLPKLAVAGQLDWVIAGQKSIVDFDDQQIIFSVRRRRELRGLAGGLSPALEQMEDLLKRSGLKIVVRAGRWLRLELFPNPSFLLKLVCPELRAVR